MAAGVVHIPWYATGFRGDDLAEALEHVSTIALRYNARSYVVYRARDDRYKFLQVLEFETKLDWERYWEGRELIEFRVNCSGWFQVPVVYGWQDVVCRGFGPGAGDGEAPTSSPAVNEGESA
ncbi:MAG: hypothetical protein QOF77_146 [Solirubrobacteraceae bacterium]|jgi:hypothetical protein|nr:hypothetical protein [Solirubrobacteraceae bacterium]